jgi:hypothetical protein
MGKKYILVATHPRSGTHFAINSLCHNFENVSFDYVRNSNASLEGLLWDHDPEYASEWKTCLNDKKDNHVKIFKTHLHPKELEGALCCDSFLGRQEKDIIEKILNESKIIYVHRDCRDVMVSWFYYCKNAGGGLIAGIKDKMANCSIAEFIRQPNKLISPIRKFDHFDKNRPKYWESHIESWIDFGNSSNFDFKLISYEDLSKNFDEAMKSLASFLGMEDLLRKFPEKPPLKKPDDFLSKANRSIKKFLGKKQKVKPAAFPRKGIVGDWKNHFSKEDLEFIFEQAGNAMKKFHYEP